MHRPPTPDELKIAQVALAKENISFDETRVVKKPHVDLLDVDKGNTRYLVDLQAQLIVNKYNIAHHAAKC